MRNVAVNKNEKKYNFYKCLFFSEFIQFTFFLIEIYNYFNLKTEDGVVVFDVRNKNFEIDELEKELSILQFHLHNKQNISKYTYILLNFFKTNNNIFLYKYFNYL